MSDKNNNSWTPAFPPEDEPDYESPTPEEVIYADNAYDPWQDPDYVPSEDYLPEEELERDEARKSALDRAGDVRDASKLGNTPANLKESVVNAAKEKAFGAVPGAEKAAEVAENTNKAIKAGTYVVDGLKNFAGALKGAVVALNPYVVVPVLAALLVVVMVVAGLAAGQVYGQTKSTSEAGYAGGAMQQRLAQRAEWLQQNYRDYDNAGQLVAMAPSPKSSVAGNAWVAACTDIVALIYGLSPYLTGYNGVKNAYQNYKNHPDKYEAWAFASGAHGDGSSSPGASLQDPPPGAIVSIENDSGWYATCCPGAGHTFVMLTDELVIDNFSGGGILQGTPGGGPRILNDTMRSHIVGWALPKGEGFEGTFITGSFEGAAENAPEQDALPNLPPVPTYMGDVVIPGDSGGSTFNGPKERADWMRAAGIAESDWGYVDYIAQKESSWNPKATNPSSGACGLIQALPCSKVPGDGYDPVDNLRWADGYAKSRYGSWEAAYEFWVANHWW